MQMIDVLKRLAQLDAKNTNVVKEGSQVQECGPMGMMDGMPGMHSMAPEKPSIPANFSINATAATGNEVADMMSQILTLAGMKQVGANDLGAEPQGALVTAEPTMSVGPMAAEPMPSAADDMRSVLDKLNPEPAGDDEAGDDLGPFQHDSEKPEDDEEKPEDDEEETDEGQYDNSPADPTNAPAFDSEDQAHHENQPGSGETSNGEKRQSNLPTATFESLMKEYKQYIGEGDEGDEKDVDESAEEELEEGTCSACHKDPCECSSTEESANEGLDILKLAGLK